MQGVTENVTVSNYRAEDPLPSFNVFTIDMTSSTSGTPSTLPGTEQGAGYFRDVLFEDIFIANVSTVRQSKSDGGCKPACAQGLPLPTGVPNIVAGGT